MVAGVSIGGYASIALERVAACPRVLRAEVGAIRPDSRDRAGSSEGDLMGVARALSEAEVRRYRAADFLVREYQIERPIAEHLISDVDIAALRVGRPRRAHGRIVPYVATACGVGSCSAGGDEEIINGMVDQPTEIAASALRATSSFDGVPALAAVSMLLLSIAPA